LSAKKRNRGPSGTYVISNLGGEKVESFLSSSLAELRKTLDLTAVLPQLAAAERDFRASG